MIIYLKIYLHVTYLLNPITKIYIICFHSFQMDQLSENEFYHILDEFYQNYIGESAINFYIENASLSHQNVLIQFKKDKALEYVTNYNKYLDENLKSLKKLFDPK